MTRQASAPSASGLSMPTRHEQPPPCVSAFPLPPPCPPAPPPAVPLLLVVAPVVVAPVVAALLEAAVVEAAVEAAVVALGVHMPALHVPFVHGVPSGFAGKAHEPSTSEHVPASKHSFGGTHATGAATQAPISQ